MGRKKKRENNIGKTDIELAGLSGPVRQVKQICYKARKQRGLVVNGNIDDDGYGDEKNYSIIFDKHGNKTEEQVFHLFGRRHKVYNENRLPVTNTSYYLDGQPMNETAKVMSREVFQYDKNGNELEQIHYDRDGKITARLVSEYDDKPRLKHVPHRSPNLTPVEGRGNRIAHYNILEKKETLRSYWSYDDRGLMIENGNRDSDGNKKNYAVRQYDSHGNIIEVRGYKDGEMVSMARHRYQYDKHGIIREEVVTTHDAEGKLTHTSEFLCNERGDKIEGHHFDGEGNSTGDYEFTPEYDDAGNIINNHWDEPEEKLESETEECEYDKHGNWVKKTTYYATSDVSWKKTPVSIFIREITYWDNESAKETPPEVFFADVKKAHDEKYNDEEKENKNPMEELSAEQLQWLSEPSHTNEPFPLFRFYALTNKEIPSMVAYTGPYIEAMALLDELQENLDAQLIHSYNTVWNQQEEKPVRYILSFPGHPGFLLSAMQIQIHNADEFEVPSFMNKRDSYDSDIVYFSQLQLLRPSVASGKLEEFADDYDFARELESYINKCSLKKKPDKPLIYIIEANSNGFVTREHPVETDFKIDDLDVNYGSGFNQFHLDLMKRFNTTTKGLVLFHGQPGTGKTYYIRHLLRSMVDKKVVIYMPPNMVDHLVEPGFMAFLSSEVQGFSEEGKTCVLLIEDAEPLLAKRQEGVRIQGITNLLNMSDGLLNDMLRLQIICTFNVDVRKLDSALLRPGRLIARKEFKALTELDANLLAQRLGIKHHFKSPATLGEIYAMRKNKDTLIHDVESDKGASTLLDDLL
jgi:hypothetical protein